METKTRSSWKGHWDFGGTQRAGARKSLSCGAGGQRGHHVSFPNHAGCFDFYLKKETREESSEQSQAG